MSVASSTVGVSNQDKDWWVEAWRHAEDRFVDHEARSLGLSATINPAKAADPYAPDLVVDGSLADLKCQSTPFFRAHDLYGLDPRFAVTFSLRGTQEGSSLANDPDRGQRYG